MIKPAIHSVGESAILLEFGHAIDLELPAIIGQYASVIERAFSSTITNCTPSYTTLLIEFHPLSCSPEALTEYIQNIDLNSLPSHNHLKPITLPTYYASEVAPDLASLAKRHSLSVEEVITLHCRSTYTVCAIGFAPGFAFLAELPKALHTPRHQTPRTRVPKGSVGIANNQTAVYPSDTPGGWQIIGNCPLTLFDRSAPEKSLLRIGDKVQFEPIDRSTFLTLGGEL
ncbi:5-oxoprolinase subunit PxpB [Vibrio sp. 10N]|uniref:5-oxoprolinase subunit PxpB n=1 Tax=Vibrio sp. 10N TaxID=3058938 RepID=UPI00281335DC|nr:allophanate hydrolase subunit 1 [Vibrio sp. 10N]